MTAENMGSLRSTIEELAAVLKEMDDFIEQNKDLNGQLEQLEEKKNTLQKLVNEWSNQG